MTHLPDKEIRYLPVSLRNLIASPHLRYFIFRLSKEWGFIRMHNIWLILDYSYIVFCLLVSSFPCSICSTSLLISPKLLKNIWCLTRPASISPARFESQEAFVLLRNIFLRIHLSKAQDSSTSHLIFGLDIMNPSCTLNYF